MIPDGNPDVLRAKRRRTYLYAAMLLLLFVGRLEAGAGDVIDVETIAGSDASIADLGWLVGHWRGEALGGVAEEIWLEPEGGTMAGMFRLVQGGRVILYELFTISEPDLVLRLKHFNADLSGWEERNEVVTFPLVRLGSAEAVFDGVTFRVMPDGRLHASVRTRQRDGTEEQIDFVLERVRGAD
jgi:hypothetical protein